MPQYEMIADDGGNPMRCESCGYPAALHGFSMSCRVGEVMLCEICAKTQIGQAYEYPHQYQGQEATMRTIGYVANKILDEIRKAR